VLPPKALDSVILVDEHGAFLTVPEQPQYPALTCSEDDVLTMRSRKPVLAALGLVAVALTLNAVLWLAQPGLAFIGSPWSFGPTVVRAEVVVKNAGGVHDFRIDRGRLMSAGPQSIVLRERDGLRVVIPVAPTTRAFFDGVAMPLARIPRGARVEAVREGDAPATRITAVSGR
jgi:hypothetical protein